MAGFIREMGRGDIEGGGEGRRGEGRGGEGMGGERGGEKGRKQKGGGGTYPVVGQDKP